MSKLTIGIGGFGIVGKGYVRYLAKHGVKYFQDRYTIHGTLELENLIIWDEKEISQQDRQEVLNRFPNVIFCDGNKTSFAAFAAQCSYILISSGVSRTKTGEHPEALINELDIFSYHLKKPTIAITGSLGKTTVTALIHGLFNAVENLSSTKKTMALGGNIGIPVLDLVDDENDWAVLELSSFQLARNKNYAPTIALWNNLYPNHLDWHGIMDDYFDCKFFILKHQSASDSAVLNESFFLNSRWAAHFAHIKSRVYLVASDGSFNGLTIPLKSYHRVYKKNDELMLARIEQGLLVEEQTLIDLGKLPRITFENNWVYVVTALFLAGIDMKLLIDVLKDEQFTWSLLQRHAQAHRVEHCKMINGVDFYNDSKSTLPQATQAAIEKLALNNRPITVILGGLDKGVDRTSFVQKMLDDPRIKEVYYFGNQMDLFPACKTFPTLEEAMNDVFMQMASGDQVLFSPSGASYDFFSNYQHRGNFFKELVENKARCLK